MATGKLIDEQVVLKHVFREHRQDINELIDRMEKN